PDHERAISRTGHTPTGHFPAGEVPGRCIWRAETCPVSARWVRRSARSARSVALALVAAPVALVAATAVGGRATPRWAGVGTDLDELAGDAGAGEPVERAGGQVGGELDQGEVGLDRDVAEVAAGEPALVGQGADDLARLDLVALADGDAVRRHGLV